MPGATSIPVTLAPRSISEIRFSPLPQPRSSTSFPRTSEQKKSVFQNVRRILRGVEVSPNLRVRNRLQERPSSLGGTPCDFRLIAFGEFGGGNGYFVRAVHSNQRTSPIHKSIHQYMPSRVRPVPVAGWGVSDLLNGPPRLGCALLLLTETASQICSGQIRGTSK